MHLFSSLCYLHGFETTHSMAILIRYQIQFCIHYTDNSCVDLALTLEILKHQDFKKQHEETFYR